MDLPICDHPKSGQDNNYSGSPTASRFVEKDALREAAAFVASAIAKGHRLMGSARPARKSLEIDLW
jgi:hypothetical protein